MERTKIRRWSRTTGALLVGVTPVVGGSLGAANAADPTAPPTPPAPPATTPSTLPSVRVPTSSSGCTGYFGGNMNFPPQCIQVFGDSTYVQSADTYIPFPCNCGSDYTGPINRYGCCNYSGVYYGYYQEIITVQRPGQTKSDYYYGPVTGPEADGGQRLDINFASYFADGTQICGQTRYDGNTTFNNACEQVISTGSGGGK